MASEHKSALLLVGLAYLGFAPVSAHAQGTRGRAPLPARSESKPPPSMIIAMKTGDTHLEVSPMPREGKIARWFELQTAAISVRYHFIENAEGLTTANNAQYQVALKGRLNLDRRGNFSIHAAVFPGDRFTGGWSDSGWGSGSAQTNLFLKQLYFSATPARGVELQYGGLYISHGESTEITSYDFDGYVVGQRLSLTRPSDLFFDVISITYAYLGDLDRANLNKRFHRLRQSNYHQLLVVKKIGRRASVSTDYTFESGVDTFRQAVKLRIPELRAIDTLHFENYQRVGSDSGYGFGVYGEKKIHATFSLGGGYAQIDQSGLNSDRFPRGKRLHLTGQLAINPEFSVTLAVTRALGENGAALPRTRLDLALGYNLLHRLRKTGLL